MIAAESFSRISRLLGPRGGKSPRLCNVTSLPEASTGTVRCYRCRSGRILISLQANKVTGTPCTTREIILQRCAKLEHAVAVVFERRLFSTCTINKRLHAALCRVYEAARG